MYLTRHAAPNGSRWAIDGKFLAEGTTLGQIFQVPLAELSIKLLELKTSEDATGAILAPVEIEQEIWASGVTYLSSRLAREAESESSADAYQKVYNAERPELFFKASGARALGHGQAIRIRRDSRWDVPEPELTLAINTQGEVIGYTVGDDVSSRSIEGENTLYLPQAKCYNGSCSIGPGIRIQTVDTMTSLPVKLVVERDGQEAFCGTTNTDQIKRTFHELVEHLYREMDFPNGSFLMTGTGIIPSEEFTLQSGDLVRIDIDGLVLENPVA